MIYCSVSISPSYYRGRTSLSYGQPMRVYIYFNASTPVFGYHYWILFLLLLSTVFPLRMTLTSASLQHSPSNETENDRHCSANRKYSFLNSFSTNAKSINSFDSANEKTIGSLEASAMYAGDASPLNAFTRESEYENESCIFLILHSEQTQ